MRLNFLRFAIAALFVIGTMAGAWAQTVIPNTTTVTETFGTGAATTTLPANWKIHASTSSPTWTGASSTTTQTGGSGTPATGGTYGWASSTNDRSYGAMTSGGFASPNNVLGYYENTGSSAINSISVTYNIKRYRTNTAAASVQFFYSLNGTSWTAVTGGDIAAATFGTAASAYNFTSPTVFSAPAFTVTFSTAIAVNGKFYLRWNLNTTGGNSQGIGLDDVAVTATFASAPSCGAPTVTASAATSVATTTATLNGNVTSIGSGSASSIAARRFEYGTSSSLSGASTITSSTGSDPFSANITGLSSNTQYYFRAKAVNDCPDSSYSTTSSHPSFYTLPDATTASAASGITASGFTATWTDVSGTIETYEIQVSTSNGFGTLAANPTGLTGTSSTVGGLASNTAYYYRVRAVNTGGNGAWSNVVGPFTTLCASPTVTASAATSVSTTTGTLNGSVSALGGGTSVNANFDWGTSATLATFSTTSNTAISTVPTAFSAGLTGLAANTRYYYRSNATNNCSTPASGSSSITSFYTLPDAPTANAGTSLTTTGFTASWNDVTGGETETYQIQISTDNTFASTNVNQTGLTSTSYTTSALSSGTTYYYRVRATNNAGTNPGAWSNTVTVNTVDNSMLINAVNVNIVQNFNSFVGTAGSIPTGWATTASTYQGVGTGTSNTGGVWAFGSSENAMGAIPNNTTGDISFTVTLRNTTGVTINTLELSYDFEQWRYEGSGNTVITALTSGISSIGTAFNQAGTTTGTNGTPTVVNKFATLTGLSVANNATFTVTFLIANATNSDHGLAIDNFTVKANPVAAPNITVTGNSTLIADADVTPSATDHTQFVNTAVGSSNTRTFTINNTGTSTLNLTGTPRVAISGSSEFSVTTQPSAASIAGGGSLTFVVTFSPTSTGSKTATVSISSDDPDAADATYTFDVAGTATGNSASDIIATASFTAPANIAYVNYTSSNITSANSMEVGKFTIRDGGATTDADGDATTLTALTFSLSNSGNIQRVALYDGSTELQEVAGASTVSFSGLNLVAADNSTKEFSLRVTYNTTVTDNQNYQFTITSATASTSGSVFAAADAGGATTSVSGNNNRIVVTADRLAFTTQPASGSINVALAAFVVSAVDVNGNVDLNATNSVNLTTTGTGATITNPYTMVSGAATVSNVQYNAIQNNITITATTTGLSSSNTVTSSQFNISTITFVTGDYRTTSSGNWLGSTGLATWEQYSGGVWSSSSRPAASTTANVYIYHSIYANASFANGIKLKVMSGGDFTVSSSSTTASIYVYAGGLLDVEASLTNNGTFDVEDNADVLLNFNFGNPSTSIWAGTENFRPNSYLLIGDWEDNGTYLINGDVTTNTYNGYTAAFGNVSIDLSLGASTWTGTWTLTGPSFGNTNITHGNLEFDSPRGYNITFSSNSGTYTAGIGGDLVLNSGWSSARNVIVSTSSATYTLNVKGNLVHNSPGTFAVRQTNAAGSSTLNVDGDIIMNGAATTASTALMMNYQVISASAGAIRAIVNLKGNLLLGALPNISNSMNPADVQFNFIANTTTHDVTVPTATSGVTFFVKSGATVRLVSNNLTLNNTSSLTVETGGTIDFNWTSANVPLLVTQPASPSGTNAFVTQQGSTMLISSPDGITTSGATGNVRTTTRTYNQIAYFTYVGKTNQVTGNGITTTGNGKVVTANLASNNITLTPSNDIGISNGTTIEAQGGRLEIQKGIVIGSATAEFTGSGRLVMTDGTYRMSETGLTLPQLTGYTAYALSGGTVELNGTGAQTLSATPSSYYNVKFSGTNTGGTDVVKTNGGLVIDNNLTITNSAIFDSENRGVTGNAGLTMNSGRWRIGKVSAVLPELTATAAGQSYSVTGGTLEYYNAGANQSQTMRAEDGNSNMITYYNVEVNAAAANTVTGNLRLNTNENVGVSNSFTVFSPASVLLNQNSAVVGTGTFEVKPDATLLYGHAAGITASGATGNVQVSGARTFPTTASYGFIGGAASMVSGSGLPATVKNLYVNKTSGTHTISLTNSLSLTGDLDFNTGLVLLGTKDISLSATSTVTGTPSATAMVVTNGTGKFIKQYNSGTSLPGFTYPVGDNTGTVEYSPASLTFASNTNAGAVGVIVTDAVHPNMGASTSYASRYWTLSNTGLTNYSYTASYTYAASDVVGTEALYKASRWSGGVWTPITGSAAAANTVTITVPQTQTTSALSGDYTARVAPLVTVYTWTGTVSTEWNNALNWDVAQVPNDCSHNVLVPSNPPSGNFPAIDVLVSVGNIQLGNSARITLDANLNVCGDWTGAPSTPAILLGNASVVFQGSTLQNITGKTQFNTLQANNTAGVQVQSGSSEVFTALELKAGNFNAGNNLVTFRSTSTTEVGIINNFSSGFTGTLSGSIKAERYYDSPAAQSFSQHFMGSPVDAPSVSQFGATGVPGVVQPLNCWIDSFASGSPYGSMYEYVEANGATCGVKVWNSITSGNTVNGKGYSVARTGAGTLTVNGAANLNSTYTVSGLGNTGYSNSASYIQTPPLTTVTINSGWHLVANPYLADLNLTTHAANSAFDAQIQVWEATGPYAGTYRPRMTNSNAVLAPFQAFLVHKTAVGGSANYNLYASDRTLAAATFYRQANQSELKLVAQNLTTGLLDETYVAFNSDATTQFDVEYDANKVQGSNTRHSLYSVVSGTDYAINTLNNVEQTSTVPVSMRPGADASFKFTVEGINTFDPTQYIYLEDKVTGQMIDLRQNPEYTFNMTTAEAFDRFVLHFTPAAQFTSADATCEAQGVINVTQPGTASWSYTVTDANNTTIGSGTLSQNSPVAVHAATGIYTVTLVDANNYTVARNVMISGSNAADASFATSATTVEEGTDVVFTANQAGSSYVWNLGNGATATGSGVTMAYTTPGVYSVELTVTTAGGCTATSTVLVTVTAKVETGIKDVTDGSLKLWSNGNKVYVDFSKAKLNNANVGIYNLIGQELSKEDVTGTIYIKEVTQFEAGYVILRVENNGNITTKKLLIANK